MKNNLYNNGCIDEIDRVVASAIAFHLVLMNCKNSLAATSSFFFEYNTILNIVCWLLIFCNYLRIIFFKNVLCRTPSSTIIVLCFLFSFCFVSQIHNPDLFTSIEFPYDYVRKTFIDFLSYSLPCFIFCSLLRNPNALLSAFYRMAWILFVFSVFAFFLYISSHSSSYEYSMSYANSVGFSIFVFLFLAYESKKIYHIIASIILMICLIICGSRGPLISIASLLFVFFLSLKGSLNVYFLRMTAFLVFLFLIIQQSFFTSSFIEFLDKFNVQSRTLRMLSTGVMNNDSGRSIYFSKVFEALNESPVLGLGAFGGSVQVGLTHNLYLDIWANFGYFAGTFLIIFLFYNLFKIYRASPNYSFIILFFSLIIFPRGFIGFDFWASKELWILFGLIVSFYSQQNTRKKTYEM